MTLSPRLIAKELEERLNQELGFNSTHAVLYDIFPDETKGFSLSVYDSNRDIYQLIDNAKSIGGYQPTIALVTTGWASQTAKETDTPPSQADDKVRVRLVIVTSPDETVSVMRIQESDEVLTDFHDGAHGPLAGAVKHLFPSRKGE